MTPCGIVLVDFEGSGFRHIGLDLAWLLFPFPNYSAHYGVLPEEVVQAAEVAYRRRLAAAVPEAGSDRQYDEMVAVGLAVALIVRTHRLGLLASEGQDVFDSWRRRTQLLHQIGVFVDRCEKSAELPDLAGWFKRLAVAMADRWPDAGFPEPPLFPAFAVGARPVFGLGPRQTLVSPQGGLPNARSEGHPTPVVGPDIPALRESPEPAVRGTSPAASAERYGLMIGTADAQLRGTNIRRSVAHPAGSQPVRRTPA